MTNIDILTRIIQHKHIEVAQQKQQLPLTSLQQQLVNAPPCRGFAAALQRKIRTQQTAIIAEIKRGSPSRGTIRDNVNVADIAQRYANAGATAISVLTDNAFFQGNNSDLQQAKAACELPILRKDFIVDPYQIYEARAIGADAILLIVAALNDHELQQFCKLAKDLGLDVLVEVHDAAELARALLLDTPLVGINNRDLRTFEISLNTSLQLLDKIPADKLVITESGVHNRHDIELMRQHNVYGFLIGESLMQAPDPGEKLTALLEAK